MSDIYVRQRIVRLSSTLLVGSVSYRYTKSYRFETMSVRVAARAIHKKLSQCEYESPACSSSKEYCNELFNSHRSVTSCLCPGKAFGRKSESPIGALNCGKSGRISGQFTAPSKCRSERIRQGSPHAKIKMRRWPYRYCARPLCKLPEAGLPRRCPVLWPRLPHSTKLACDFLSLFVLIAPASVAFPGCKYSSSKGRGPFSYRPRDLVSCGQSVITTIRPLFACG